MNNKIILITGTNEGIGKSILKLLEKEKCTVIATTRKKIKFRTSFEVGGEGFASKNLLTYATKNLSFKYKSAKPQNRL